MTSQAYPAHGDYLTQKVALTWILNYAISNIGKAKPLLQFRMYCRMMSDAPAVFSLRILDGCLSHRAFFLGEASAVELRITAFAFIA
jgi:hypothetical protein